MTDTLVVHIYQHTVSALHSAFEFGRTAGVILLIVAAVIGTTWIVTVIIYASKQIKEKE